jgi:Protein of unknown function (DUF2934)
VAKPRVPRNSKKNGDAKTDLVGVPQTASPLATDTEFRAPLETKTNVVPINLEDEIRRRAYELFEERGCIAGDEHEDWLRAEREVLARYRQQSA